MSFHRAAVRVTLRLVALLALPLLVCGEAFAADAQTIIVSPALASTLDTVVLEITFYCGLQIPPPVVNGHTILVSVNTLNPPPPCPPEGPILLQFPLPPLPAGSYTVIQIVDGVASPETTVFQVAAPTACLLLLDAHFIVTASFLIPGGTPVSLTANAVQLSDVSGYFWFFDGANVELTVKILDGRAVNNHYWVFIASTTNVAYDVTVTDLLSPAIGCSPGSANPCISKTYSSPAGTNQNFIDIGYWADFP